MPDDDGVHVVGSGGSPQTRIDKPWKCKWLPEKPLIVHVDGKQGSCPQCFGWVPLTFGYVGYHESADPTWEFCPVCDKRYPELKRGQKSYTNPVCTECADAHDERDREAAGFVPTLSEQEAW